jgi:putative FmdB family regulatory protein
MVRVKARSWRVTLGRRISGGGIAVPLYEYVCEKCSHEFEELVFGSATPCCPSCKAAKVRRVLSVVTVGRSTDRTRAATPEACGTCRDPRGPGACGMR